MAMTSTAWNDKSLLLVRLEECSKGCQGDKQRTLAHDVLTLLKRSHPSTESDPQVDIGIFYLSDLTCLAFGPLGTHMLSDYERNVKITMRIIDRIDFSNDDQIKYTLALYKDLLRYSIFHCNKKMNKRGLCRDIDYYDLLVESILFKEDGVVSWRLPTVIPAPKLLQRSRLLQIFSLRFGLITETLTLQDIKHLRRKDAMKMLDLLNEVASSEWGGIRVHETCVNMARSLLSVYFPDIMSKMQSIEKDSPVASPVIESKTSNERLLTIFHAQDTPGKILKAPVKILLALTPKSNIDSIASYRTVGWKILNFRDFDVRIDEETVYLHMNFGFALFRQVKAGIVQVDPQDLCVVVPSGRRAVLNGGGGEQFEWTTELNQNPSEGFIGVRNATRIPVSLALCMIDDTDSEAPTCFAVGVFGPLSSGEIIDCPAPVRLQAFAVSKNHQEGKIVNISDLKNNLLDIEKPFNILSSDSPEKSIYRLYSNANGKIILEIYQS